MTIIEIIAANLSAWMERAPGLDTIAKLAERSEVGFGTIRRMKNGNGNPTIQNLEEVANAFGRTAIDLISPPTKAQLEIEEPAAVYQMPEQRSLEAPIDQIVSNARSMSRDGQFVLLGQSHILAKDYARAKANRHN